MRVTAEADFTAVIHGGQMLEVKRGDVFKGDVAAYLLHSGAAVTSDEQTERAASDQTDQAADELNIDGKIEEVLAWVGADAERALEAHSAEEARGDKARSTLLTKLAELVNEV